MRTLDLAESTLGATLAGALLLVSGCSEPIPADPDAGTAIPDGGATGLTVCVPATGAGTIHDKEIRTDETWTAAASPHRVTFGIRLLATVRVEACAVVLIDPVYTITLGTSGTPGALIAKGERGFDATGAPVRRPVKFAAADAAKPWGSLTVTADGTLDLETVDLFDAAAPASDQGGGGAVVAWGKGLDSSAVTRNVRAVDVVVDRSRGYGFNFQSLAGFADGSEEIAVKNGGRADAAYPIRLSPGALATLPPKLTLSGNAVNEVQIMAGNGGMLSDTIRARGAPYRVSGRLRVAPHGDGAPATLNVEPGVTLKFDRDGSDNGLHVGTSDVRKGVLVAAGTASAPITFTSAKAAPAPGDWKNLYFAYSTATGNRIENAVIEYAGEPSGAQGYGCGPIDNDASILILFGRPDQAFVKNTTLRSGAGDTGILLGWTSDLDGPDFVSTNTFASMPACRVSRWRSASGACPGTGSPVCL